ncbi:MAG: DUF4190 domain-containing protein [Bacteroidales bacterium]
MEDFTNNAGQPREQLPGQTPKPAGQTLGIAALITAIVTFVIGVIPCVGLIAVIPGIIAIVLASVGLSQAARNDSPRGVLLAGLIIGIVATLISMSQIMVVGKIGDKFDKDWGGDIENVIKDVQKDVLDGLEDANVDIRIENGVDTINIKVGEGREDRMRQLEGLEEGRTVTNDTVDKNE